MRILYHHRTAAQDGQAVHIDEMVGALRAQGHEVRVVAPGVSARHSWGADPGWAQRARERLPKAVYELLELGYSLVAYRKLLNVARDFKPDVLYERCNLFLLSGVMLRKRLGLPFLLEVNAPLAEERQTFGGLGLPRLARWSERMAWRSADCVLPVTQVLARHLLHEGVQSERITVIPNGINERLFATAPTAQEAKARLGWGSNLVLGFTGFVRDWHGVDRVLRWMATSAAPVNAHLLVVGDGPARASLEALADHLHLRPRIRFTGLVPRQDVPIYAAAFDIALQPAVTAYASPLKLFEYLALAKAIIAPRSPNIEEVLRDGHNAALFEDGDVSSLERLLTLLSHDAGLRHSLALNAKATIVDKGLTWENNAAVVVQLSQELLVAKGAVKTLAAKAVAS
jgi:glycosyltransferase involved in cell wall biosynthesis